MKVKALLPLNCAALLAIAGCGGRVVYVKPGASSDAYQSDIARCEYEAASSTSTYGSGQPVARTVGGAIGQGIGLGIGRSMEANNLIALCMRARGYTQAMEGSIQAAPVVYVQQSPPSAVANQQPVAAAPFVGGLKMESRYLLNAEALAKSVQCVPPAATMTAKGAGEESFIVACPNGSTITMTCDASGCRVLR